MEQRQEAFGSRRNVGMSPKRWAAAGILIVATVACEAGGRGSERSGAAAVEQDRAGINKIRNEYASAWRAANADQVAGLYAVDSLVLYPNQPAVVGRGAILAYFKAFFTEFAPETFELTSAEIEIAGSWAFDRGTYRWRAVARAGGEAIADDGKYLVILQRQTDGSWKVARDMDNSDRPLAQAARGSD
jgi:uncharacterized protein (TIGR02246 family)